LKITGPACPWGDRSKELGHEPAREQRDFHLQHPQDQHFRRVRAGVDDGELLELVDLWIAALDSNYGALVASIPGDCEKHADLRFDARPAEPCGEAPTGLPAPAPMRVLDVTEGELGAVEPVATQMLLVAGGASPQPDGIALMPGERWRIRGHRLEDGSIMPCWGTYRVGTACGG
jgi:hypothetical protein